MASSLTRTILLNNGRQMPRLGLGTYLVKGEPCQEVVSAAINIGYRLIDTAYSYGNEKDIGEAVKSQERAGKIKRDQLFITTKVPPVYLAPADAKRCIEESCENLQSRYIDLLLIHTPFGLKNRGDGVLKRMQENGMYEYENYNLNRTWSVFEDAVKVGTVKSIGLSNFTEKQIENILNGCMIPPQNVQFECHAYYQQKALKQFCANHRITCTGYGPLGAPGIPSHHQSAESPSSPLLEDDKVRMIAAKYSRTPAQILLRFLLQQDFIVIPKTSSVERLEENFGATDFAISQSDMHTLEWLDRELRYFKFVQYSKHPNFPKGDEPY